MFKLLLLLFLTVPMVEMAILIWVGGFIGALPTILAVASTAVVGVWLLRLQGFLTMKKVQERLRAGELPDLELLEGAVLLVGGTLLLTPGFVTDIIGFVCLIPGTRRAICRRVLAAGLLKPMPVDVMQGGNIFNQPGQNPQHGSNQTIEGEYQREDS